MTSIEWTDVSWNPVTGCTKVSEGCRNCYAESNARRFFGKKYPPVDGRPRRFTDVQCHEDRLEQPLHWRKPRRVFVNSMSDLFHEDVPTTFVAQVLAVIANDRCRQHTFQVLTKRPERAREVLREVMQGGGILQLPRNLWLGVSVEDQRTAEERIPHLFLMPHTTRFVSAEPLLGPIDLSRLGKVGSLIGGHECINALCGYAFSPPGGYGARATPICANLDWVIVGGESGRGARPMHPEWVRSLRDQCTRAGTPFFFKQWGEWAPCPDDEWTGMGPYGKPYQIALSPEGDRCGGFLGKGAAAEREREGWRPMQRIGKKAAGRELDGRTWDETPAVAS